ncbi:Radical SAM domain protein [Desulforamulus reducens MI-1]|uniref:Radical SAM domain protein n=1 Tax=Desulforamulus reducens (strain ATCC BAA-1160 / DSM 100696 / MI-1) TaxID=349161 RepID=A4J7I6_DESRM|nr:radical SAM protein [Desulforamulus reducens]ABO51039.1 Radical SAM domain protein [Desulforamulus reducens MI-1]
MSGNSQHVIYRPPSEAKSFILRVTEGCSHNKCTFCSMYRNIRFRVRSLDEVECEIQQMASFYPGLRRVFLADGNALVLNTDKLLAIMKKLHVAFPMLTRITCYGAPKDILHKKPDELKALQRAGLQIIYLGIESGDDQVLSDINKGVTANEMIAAGQRVLEAGIKLSAMVILGLGGQQYTNSHALNTARVINAIGPTMLGVLTLALFDGTPLKDAVDRGDFLPLTTRETLLELKEMLENINVQQPCIFRCNHISNLLPLKGVLNRDKAQLLADVQEMLEFLQNNSYNHQNINPTHF